MHLIWCSFVQAKYTLIYVRNQGAEVLEYHRMAPDRKIKHEYFLAPPLEDLMLNKDTWFYRYGLGAVSPILTHPDVTVSRMLVASMLTEAWNCDRFFNENGHMVPEPNEFDRMLQITSLQQIASLTGLLNGEEIRLIQANEGDIPLPYFRLPEPPLLTFDEARAATQEWKAQGETIGCFQGSFDPTTAIHLGCATEAYSACDKLLIGFDSDRLLRSRKGEDRPRFKLDDSRKKFGR